MAGTAKKADPALWERVKQAVTEGDKGGRPGQWSARKAQLASHEYQKQGGQYLGGKTADNHLSQWTEEEWGTKSGAESGDTGERYLPKQAREHLTDEEYRRTTAKKRRDTAKGKQFSRQPDDVARKTAEDRTPHHGSTPHDGQSPNGHSPGGHAPGSHALDGLSLAELMERARAAGIAGRSRMRKEQLRAALRG